MLSHAKRFHYSLMRNVKRYHSSLIVIELDQNVEGCVFKPYQISINAYVTAPKAFADSSSEFTYNFHSK